MKKDNNTGPGGIMPPERNMDAAGMRVRLSSGDLHHWSAEHVVIDYGLILICRSGRALLHVNFDEFELTADSVITLFPNDVVMVSGASDDFATEYLRYDASILREASLQLEQTVYSQLRGDRCRSRSPIVTDIINAMFGFLNIYFRQKDCRCLEQLVLLQLKAFFIGFYDYLQRFPDERPAESGSRRARELFNRFMYLLEAHYRESRDVAWFAARMRITPKYLNNVVRSISGHSVKTIIDHYVVLQLKLTLRSTTLTVKEVAWLYHFSDVSFFCRYFKQRTGCTPQEFKKRVIFTE